MDTWYTQLMTQAGAAAGNSQNWFDLPTVDDSSASGDFQKLLDEKTQATQPNSQPKDKSEPAKTEAKPKDKPKTESKGKASSEDAEEPAVQVGVEPWANLDQLVEAGIIQIASSELTFTQGPLDEGAAAQPLIPMIEIAPEIPVQTVPVEEAPVLETQPVAEASEELLTQPAQDAAPVAAPQEAVELPETAPAAQTVDAKQPEIKTAQPVETAKAPEAQNAVQDADEDEVVADVSTEAQPLFHDVKAAPIKVAEAPAAEQTEEVDVGEQLLDPLAQAVQQGDSRVTVRLTPETLGTVEVQITQNADGALHVVLTAASSETRGLLEKHAANLQLMLANRTQDTVQVEVQRHEESQQGQNHSYEGHGENQSRRQQEQQQQQNHPKSSDDFLQQLRLGLIPLDAEAILPERK